MIKQRDNKAYNKKITNITASSSFASASSTATAILKDIMRWIFKRQIHRRRVEK